MGNVLSAHTQNTAYSGTDLIPFSNPKFLLEIRMEYAGLYFSTSKEFFDTIVEIDETYVGGKPRKGSNKDDDDSDGDSDGEAPKSSKRSMQRIKQFKTPHKRLLKPFMEQCQF